MDTSALFDALNVARNVEAGLAEQLGAAILSSDKERVIGLQQELREAEGKTAELERAVSAVQVATAAAERARLEREAREAREARARLVEDARTDHANIVRKAQKIDKALAALDLALEEMEATADSFASKYRDLGLHARNKSWLSARTWITEVVHRFKSQSHRSLRNHLIGSGLLTYGSGKPVAQTVPSFEALIDLRPGDIVTSNDNEAREAA